MKDLLVIFSGILIFTFGNLFFAIPNHIMAGGVTGLSTVLYYVFGVNIGLTFFLLNLPLFLIAWRVSRGLVSRSIVSMFLSSVIIGLLQPFLLRWGTHNIVLGSVAGGTIMGLGLGIMGASNSSLGGGSLTGKLLHHKFGFSISLTTLLFDSLVYPISLFAIGRKETIFSLILSLFSALGIRLISWAVEKKRKGAMGNGLSIKPNERILPIRQSDR